jgi:4-alpha-glucanotransferase
MGESAVQSYRVFMFERVGDGLFARPDTYPADALVTFGTHDLPTIAGFWQGRDLELRRDLDLYPDERTQAEDAEGRVGDRQKLLDALIDQGLMPPDSEAGQVDVDSALLTAIHRYLARTPARLMMVQIEDLARQVEMMNMPGTVDSHPNWRRRLARTIDDLFDDDAVQALLAAVAEERAGG